MADMVEVGQKVTGPFMGVWTVMNVDISQDGDIKNDYAQVQHPEGPYNAARPQERWLRWCSFPELTVVTDQPPGA